MACCAIFICDSIQFINPSSIYSCNIHPPLSLYIKALRGALRLCLSIYLLYWVHFDVDKTSTNLYFHFYTNRHHPNNHINSMTVELLLVSLKSPYSVGWLYRPIRIYSLVQLSYKKWRDSQNYFCFSHLVQILFVLHNQSDGDRNWRA